MRGLPVPVGGPSLVGGLPFSVGDRYPSFLPSLVGVLVGGLPLAVASPRGELKYQKM